MRLYIAHFQPPDAARAGAPPVLLKQGLSWPCLLLGWVGLLLCGSWIAALLAGAVTIAIGLLLRGLTGAPATDFWPVLAGLHLLLGVFGNELRGWEFRLRGFVPGALVAGPDAETAMVRLLDQQPELVGSSA